MATAEIIEPSILPCDNFAIAVVRTAIYALVQHDSPEATAPMTEDDRVLARSYYRQPPDFAIMVDEPWWWAVLACGADVINTHFDVAAGTRLAIVARSVKPMDKVRDVEALEAILKAGDESQCSSLHAWRCPANLQSKIVGMVEVADSFDNSTADVYGGPWFSGPYGLLVTNKVILREDMRVGTDILDRERLVRLRSSHKESIRYALTAMANGVRRW